MPNPEALAAAAFQFPRGLLSQVIGQQMNEVVPSFLAIAWLLRSSLSYQAYEGIDYSVVVEWSVCLTGRIHGITLYLQKQAFYRPLRTDPRNMALAGAGKRLDLQGDTVAVSGMLETDQQCLVLKIDVIDPVDHVTHADIFAISQKTVIGAGIEEMRRC